MNNRLALCLPFTLLLLSACGKGNGPGAGGADNDARSDSYVNAVSVIVDSAPEDAESLDMEAHTPSMPEDSEPQVIS